MFNLLIFLFLILASISSCKKPEVKGNTVLEQYFESNILNRNFIVTQAGNEGDDITALYTGYVFVLGKTDFYHGPLTVTHGNLKYQGSWSSNDDYSKLTISLPATPPEFVFLTRNWRFTSKTMPDLKLAPWGSTANITLTMSAR